MGGPVLLADFNELLWGSDQWHQKQHSAIQLARFNASLRTTVSSLDVMKAPAAGRTTRETSSKHMWSVICWKGFAENQGNLTWVGLISLLCWALIYSALRRRWRQGYWTGIEALQDMRENGTVASLTDGSRTRSMKYPMCLWRCTPKIQKWREEAAGNKICWQVFNYYLSYIWLPGLDLTLSS